MAKVSGPLHSDDARGKFASSMVFMGWKGLRTVRQLVTPMNKRSNGQAAARTFLAVAGIINRMIESISKGALTDSVLYTQIFAVTPSNQSQAAYFVNAIIGVNQTNVLAARALWTSAGGTEKGYYTTAAATIPLTGFDLGYGTVDPVVAGEHLLIAAYGAYVLGLAIMPVSPEAASQSQVNAFAAAFLAS
jgi:hypothetical protein